MDGPLVQHVLIFVIFITVVTSLKDFICTTFTVTFCYTMNLQELLQVPGYNIVDVRTTMEFMSGHVQDSINIPLDEIAKHLEEFKAMNGDIILCCASGARSEQAVLYLRAHGIDKVYNGGGWMELSYLKSMVA